MERLFMGVSTVKWHLPTQQFWGGFEAKDRGAHAGRPFCIPCLLL